MCIRDRGKDVRGQSQEAGKGENVASAPVVNEGTAATVGKPVSYTHLRAHETVLDLVCRLLLEKKKQQQSSKLKQQAVAKQNNSESGQRTCQ